jgi:hypothetical protein
VPVEAHRLEALERAPDQALVLADDAERAQRERLRIGARLQQRRCLLLDLFPISESDERRCRRRP